MPRITRIRRRVVRAASISAPCCLVLAPSALAGVPATPISERTIDAVPASLAFDGAGNAVASWRGLRGPSADETRLYVAWAGQALGAPWRAGPALPATVVAHDVAVSRAGVVALATAREHPLSGGRSRSSIVLNIAGSRTLAVSSLRLLARGPARPVTFEGPQPSLHAPRAAVARNGRIVVAWQRSHPRSQVGVWVAVRRSDGSLRAARRIGPGGGVPALTLAPDGSGLVAWQLGRRIVSRRLLTDGRWTATETVATAPATSATQLDSLAVTGARGRFAAAAVVTRRTTSGVRISVSAHVRTRSSGWRSKTLGAFEFRPTGQTSYVTNLPRALPLITTDDRIRVVWPSLDGGRVRAAVTRLRVRRSGLEAGETVMLSDAPLDVALDDAAAGPSGRYAVTWFDLAGGGGSPSLAEAAAGGSVRVTARLAGERALLGSRVAYDPASGRWSVLWTEGTSPQGYRPVTWTSAAP